MTSLSIAIDYLKSIIDGYEFSVKPLVVGLSGPQGSGKSYLAEHLSGDLRSLYPHLNIVQFSMDDLYLTHEEQSKLNVVAKTEMLNNRLLQGRGLPGTHDIELGMQIFEQLIESKTTSSHLPIHVPLYDKSAFQGEGDRFESSKWQTITSPVDIILFEGWFNGFEPLDSDQLKLAYLTSDPGEILQRHKLFHLEEINETLKGYSKIWRLFDKFIFIHTTDIDNVYKWRIEQEHALLTLTGGKGMTDAQVIKFVDRYMPMYKLYYERMCDIGVVKSPQSNLKLTIDISRRTLSHHVI